MNEILTFSATFYYTDLLLLATSTIAFLFSIINSTGKPQLKLLPVYLFSSMLQSTFTLLDIIFPNIPTIQGHSLSNLLISAFILIEYLTVTTIFYKYIVSNRIRRFLKLNCIAYIICFFTYHLIFKTDRIEVEHFYLLHAAFVLIPPSAFIYWIFKSEPIFDLKNFPPFWLTIGTYSCILGTLPIFAIGDTIFNIESKDLQLELFAINNISYTIFFLLIIKAYRCKQIPLA